MLTDFLSVVYPKRLPTRRVGSRGAIAPLKPTKVTLFTMILFNSENSTRDTRPFCRPLFCHSSVVKYLSYSSELDLTTTYY